MRQTSAESREIDLMMRQWKPAKQMLALPSAALQISWMVFLAAGVGSSAVTAHADQAATPVSTRTSLTVASRDASQSRSQTETVLTAHVTDAAGNLLSRESGAGSVSFDLETSSLGSAIVDEHGDAVLVASSLPRAADNPLKVHAVYHPAPAGADGPVSGSVSASALLQSDATGIADFSVTANPTTLTVTKGQSATTKLTVTPVNGFSEQVTLSCSSPPAQTTCTFSPVIESTANGAFTSTLQIQTEADSGWMRAPDRPGAPGSQVAFAWLLPGALALAGFAALRRRTLASAGKRAALLVVGSVLLGLGGLGGCSSRYGYNHHPPAANTGTATGTYTLSINASGNDGSAVTSHDVNVVLVVQ